MVQHKVRSQHGNFDIAIVHHTSVYIIINPYFVRTQSYYGNLDIASVHHTSVHIISYPHFVQTHPFIWSKW